MKGATQTKQMYRHPDQMNMLFIFHRVSLDSEVSHTSRLQSEQQSSRDAVSQLEREVEGLQTLLTSVTSELEEARSRLTQYQQTEDSLERSAHTISSLHQVGRYFTIISCCNLQLHHSIWTPWRVLSFHG